MTFGDLKRERQPGVVRLGEGAGFSGAWVDPAVDLAKRGNLDYLLFECLAERTIALAQLSRLNDPSGGYDPHLARRMEAVLPYCWPSGTRILTNSGAANPLGAGERIVAIARKLGFTGLRVGVVTGDDVLDALDLDTSVIAETGQTLREIAPALVSANAYIGAEPLIEALDQSYAVSFVPGHIDGHGPPEFASPAEAADIVDHMRTISAPYGTMLDVAGAEVQVRLA